jgi:hypothetical protein
VEIVAQDSGRVFHFGSITRASAFLNRHKGSMSASIEKGLMRDKPLIMAQWFADSRQSWIKKNKKKNKNKKK